MTGLVKKSFRLAGHATSIALEPEFWQVLTAQAATEQLSLAALVGRIDEARSTNLASALRVYALQCVQKKPESLG